MTDYQRLKQIRTKLDFRQGEFATKLNMKQGSYSDVERGKASISYNLLKKLSKHFNVNPGWIVTGKGVDILTSGTSSEYNIESIDYEKSYIERRKKIQALLGIINSDRTLKKKYAFVGLLEQHISVIKDIIEEYQNKNIESIIPEVKKEFYNKAAAIKFIEDHKPIFDEIAKVSDCFSNSEQQLLSDIKLFVQFDTKNIIHNVYHPKRSEGDE